MRLQYGILRPKVRILGYDIAGHVEAAGKNVTQFKSGDEVFGGLGFRLGGFAEYACIAENGFVVLKPSGTTFEEAASVPAAAVTALRGIRDTGHIQPGQKVLINGAAGGVGRSPCRLPNLSTRRSPASAARRIWRWFVQSEQTMLLTTPREDFSRNGHTYDLILDNVGNRTVPDLIRILSPTGRCVLIGFTSMRRLLMQSLLAPIVNMGSGRRIRHASSGTEQRGDRLPKGTP